MLAVPKPVAGRGIAVTEADGDVPAGSLDVGVVMD
jgi:hypothetical protein